jgi:hypothetical protein
MFNQSSYIAKDFKGNDESFMPIDNRGEGDCGFLAFAIGLISCLQDELSSNKDEQPILAQLLRDKKKLVQNNKSPFADDDTFTQNIREFKFNQPKLDNALLNYLNHLLRFVLVNYKIEQIESIKAISNGPEDKLSDEEQKMGITDSEKKDQNIYNNAVRNPDFNDALRVVNGSGNELPGERFRTDVEMDSGFLEALLTLKEQAPSSNAEVNRNNDEIRADAILRLQDNLFAVRQAIMKISTNALSKDGAISSLIKNLKALQEKSLGSIITIPRLKEVILEIQQNIAQYWEQKDQDLEQLQNQINDNIEAFKSCLKLLFALKAMAKINNGRNDLFDPNHLYKLFLDPSASAKELESLLDAARLKKAVPEVKHAVWVLHKCVEEETPKRSLMGGFFKKKLHARQSQATDQDLTSLAEHLNVCCILYKKVYDEQSKKFVIKAQGQGDARPTIRIYNINNIHWMTFFTEDVIVKHDKESEPDVKIREDLSEISFWKITFGIFCILAAAAITAASFLGLMPILVGVLGGAVALALTTVLPVGFLFAGIAFFTNARTITPNPSANTFSIKPAPPAGDEVTISPPAAIAVPKSLSYPVMSQSPSQSSSNNQMASSVIAAELNSTNDEWPVSISQFE